MSAPAFTPGPWAIGFSDGSGADEDGYTITAGDHPARTDDNIACPIRSGRDEWGVVMGVDNVHNARLIAAAPELYEALSKALWMIEQHEGTSDANDRIVDVARAALAKAVQP